MNGFTKCSHKDRCRECYADFRYRGAVRPSQLCAWCGHQKNNLHRGHRNNKFCSGHDRIMSMSVPNRTTHFQQAVARSKREAAAARVKANQEKTLAAGFSVGTKVCGLFGYSPSTVYDGKITGMLYSDEKGIVVTWSDGDVSKYTLQELKIIIKQGKEARKQKTESTIFYNKTKTIYAYTCTTCGSKVLKNGHFVVLCCEKVCTKKRVK